GRGVDAAEPTRRVMREEPPVSSAISRMESQPQRSAPRPDLSGGNLLSSPRRAESPTLSPNGNGNGTAAGGNRNSGWLSDLLQRASQPPEFSTEERPARHTIESLDSLSVDIARMIDHNAATELWDR